MSTCTRCDQNRGVPSNDALFDASNINLDDCYNYLISLMPAAGILAMEGFNKADKNIESKHGDWDLVTIYDRAIENLFIESIRKLFVNHV